MDIERTLYERLGGQRAFENLVDYFYAQVLLDFELRPYFEGVDIKRLRNHQVQFLSAAAGGPAYEGRDLQSAHAGMGITGGAFQRVADHLKAAMEHLGMPAAEAGELLTRVASYRSQVVEE